MEKFGKQIKHMGLTYAFEITDMPYYDTFFLYTRIEILFLSFLNAFILACKLEKCMANFILFCSVNPILQRRFTMSRDSSKFRF